MKKLIFLIFLTLSITSYTQTLKKENGHLYYSNEDIGFKIKFFGDYELEKNVFTNKNDKKFHEKSSTKKNKLLLSGKTNITPYYHVVLSYHNYDNSVEDFLLKRKSYQKLQRISNAYPTFYKPLKKKVTGYTYYIAINKHIILQLTFYSFFKNENKTLTKEANLILQTIKVI